MVAQISYENSGPEREAAMGACHGVHIEGFAAGGSLALKCASVPGCSSELKPVVMVRDRGRGLLRIRCRWGIMLG
jgi:hypothetical protein